MIIDLNNVENPNVFFEKFDLCIIGGGAAGIAIAQHLNGEKFSVCLIEAGGENYSYESQKRYDGNWTNEIFGQKQIVNKRLISDRLRYFGGTTNHWTGRCRRFDQIDFKKRSWIPHSGWPIGLKDLTVYYKKAENILDLNFLDYEAELNDLNRIGDFFRKREFTFSPPTRMGKKYKNLLSVSENITVVLNCNFKRLKYTDSFENISGIICSDYKKNEFSILCREVILATGGVENTRILLNENLHRSFNKVNIGRYFMGHAIWKTGEFFYSNNFNLTSYLTTINESFLTSVIKDSRKFYKKVQVKLGKKRLDPSIVYKENRSNQSFISLDEKAQQKLKLPNMGVTLESEYFPTNLDLSYYSILKSSRKLDYSALGCRTLLLRAEQVPDFNSFISLSNVKDQFGLFKADVNWTMNNIDLYSIKKFNQFLNFDLNKTNLGFLKNNFDVNEIPEQLWSGAHHLGGTRMSDTSFNGVVDKNLKVFGFNNLYVVGGSVFPTSGLANPTLTIVALSLKLGDYIKRKINS